jgi:hypothetical protein
MHSLCGGCTCLKIRILFLFRSETVVYLKAENAFGYNLVPHNHSEIELILLREKIFGVTFVLFINLLDFIHFSIVEYSRIF